MRHQDHNGSIDLIDNWDEHIRDSIRPIHPHLSELVHQDLLFAWDAQYEANDHREREEDPQYHDHRSPKSVVSASDPTLANPRTTDVVQIGAEDGEDESCVARVSHNAVRTLVDEFVVVVDAQFERKMLSKGLVAT
jgi:hypothetical protein